MNSFTLNLRRYTWDVAMLSASYYIIKNIERHFYKVELAYLAHSYLVNSHYYGELIDNFSEAISIMQSHYAGETSDFQSIDSNWLKLMKEDNWVGIYLSVGIQKLSFSDIENTFMDREAFFHRTLDEIKQYGSY